VKIQLDSGVATYGAGCVWDTCPLKFCTFSFSQTSTPY